MRTSFQSLRRATAYAGALLGFALLLLTNGCSQHSTSEAIDTDANGFLCLKCDAKFYTDSKVFIGPKCPKCGQDTLNDVVGYLCEKDHHLTIRPRIPSLPGASVCEQCQTHLKNAMYLPREKDLVVWGAIKAGPQ